MPFNHFFVPIALLFLCSALCTSDAIGQACVGEYVPDGDEMPCGEPGIPCCSEPFACNGPNSPCNNYDPDFQNTGGCDLSCTAGCMDEEAENYDAGADFEDGTCVFPVLDECDAIYNPDSNCDSLIGFQDFLEFLTLFGEEFIPASIDDSSDDGSDSTGTSSPNYSIDFVNDTLYLIQDDTLVVNQVPFNLCCGELQASTAPVHLDNSIGLGVMETVSGSFSSYVNGPSDPSGALFPSTLVSPDSVYRIEYVYQQASGSCQNYSLRVQNKQIWNNSTNEKTNFWVFPGDEISMHAGGWAGCTGNYSVNWLVSLEKFALVELAPDTLFSLSGNVNGVLQGGETTGEPFESWVVPEGWKYHLRWFYLSKGGVCHNSHLRIDNFNFFPESNLDTDIWIGAGTHVSMQHGGWAGCNGAWSDSYYLQVEGYQIE